MSIENALQETKSSADSHASQFPEREYAAIATFSGYVVAAGAAMLAFFFNFQGIMIVNFPKLITLLTPIKYIAFPTGKISATIICIAIILFNIWSLIIIKMTIHYFWKIADTGQKLEKFSTKIILFKNLFDGRAMNEGLGFSRLPFYFTLITMFFICLIWLAYIAVIWSQ